MASGDLMAVFHPHAAELPSSAFARPDVRNRMPVLDYDAATDWNAHWSFLLPPSYSGGGITLHLLVAASTATSGASRWQAAVERGTTDMDADSFASDKSVGITANGTSGIATEGTIAFTSGAEMDSLAAGEKGRVRIRRDADGTSGTDDQTGDAELVLAWLTET